MVSYTKPSHEGRNGIFFLQGEPPGINIVYVDGGDKKEDTFDHIIYSQRCKALGE
jgi:hypothetical protein